MLMLDYEPAEGLYSRGEAVRLALDLEGKRGGRCCHQLSIGDGFASL
jgi:hypothetical protein